ncbi:related to SGF73-SAGA associated factor [Rhynchosporium secalis]|uniref:Related to SGF73-SAGA associated factor n=1 Tax=Rhynchosporium secalis TaxID=38038 RepID=A0A1E1MK58_RHYSE|nr:related to SGF73-SAGA associated factor [Rhynchosporium secalis]
MAAGSNSNANASDDDTTIKVAPKKEGKDKTSGTIKLKKPPPKHNKPGNWRDGSITDGSSGPPDPSMRPYVVITTNSSTSNSNSLPVSPGPIVNPLDDAARDTFPTGRPLEDGTSLLQCKHCKKSIMKDKMPSHLTQCLETKRQKAQRKKEQKELREKERKKKALEEERDEEGDSKMVDGEESEEDGEKGGTKSVKKSAGKKVEDGEKKGKKRKADGEAEKGPKMKKKKEEPKPKAPKARGPVDVEKQCGVIKDGVPCARSLTCKSHSMGAKRAVPGRSLPYDMLLAAYQKKNQAKQQKAAIDANAPLEDEDEGHGPVDSDEELAAVQYGLLNWNPQPVVQPIISISIERQYQKERLREQMMHATNGGTINIFKVVGLGAQKLRPDQMYLGEGADGAGGEGGGEGIDNKNLGGLNDGMAAVAAKRASGFNMQLPPQRKGSGNITNRLIPGV